MTFMEGYKTRPNRLQKVLFWQGFGPPNLHRQIGSMILREACFWGSKQGAIGGA